MRLVIQDVERVVFLGRDQFTVDCQASYGASQSEPPRRKGSQTDVHGGLLIDPQGNEWWCFHKGDWVPKLPPRRFFDRIHDEQQIRVKSALHSFSGLTVALSILHLTYGADLFPNGLDVIADIVAVRCLDGLRHLREQAKERAAPRIFEAAGSFVGSIRADTADSLPNGSLQFFQRAFHRPLLCPKLT